MKVGEKATLDITRYGNKLASPGKFPASRLTSVTTATTAMVPGMFPFLHNT